MQMKTDWNPKQTELRKLLSDPDGFDTGLALCKELHSIVQFGEVYGAHSYADDLYDSLTPKQFTTMPTIKDVTIAWDLWHITRIEDLTMNCLVAETDPVLNAEWSGRLGTAVTDTGNAMTDPEILKLSNALDMEALKAYRIAVGKRSLTILNALKPEDLGRKTARVGIERIHALGGVTEHPDSIWLLDFWSRKTVKGLLLMPLTRHQIGHLNEAMRLKKRIKA